MLFTIVIQTLIQFLEFFYSVFYKITGNEGVSVIGLSFVVTFCTLPLYMVAEGWQEKEREIQEKLKDGIQRIKQCFKGDEQYMILSTFYRQNHYHPMMALRSSISLLIQIPFFIAAYTFLSHLDALKGVSFLFIKDFGSPDALFSLGGFTVNVLPIAMTVINCVSGAIYSRGHGKGEKIQIYGCALVFLVLLYNSPAGLVVYWTMNNILSLVKNIFYKIKNPKKVLYVMACVVAAFCIAFPFTPFKTRLKIFNNALFVFGFVIPLIPFAMKFLAKRIESNFPILDRDNKIRNSMFFISAAGLALLAGLCIPSMIVVSEPVNYCYVESVDSPFVFIRHTFFMAIGFFVFWPACFYGLFSAKVKKGFALIFSLALFGALINTFAFSGDYGALLPECLFMFDVTIDVSAKEMALHFFVIAVAFALLVYLVQKFPQIVRSLSCIVILSMSVLVAKNMMTINREYKIMERPVIQTEIKPAYHLSKNGKNVIVIMQDRLFSPMVGEVLKNFPEMNDDFDGFVYYPNTVSNGWLTMIGVPEVFGGYDFTPYEINKRTDETLQQKHNKSLLTMPVLFNEAGFDTTVANLPYENFLEYPMDAMYDGYEFIRRADTRGVYTDLWYVLSGIEKKESLEKVIRRNMILFSIFKMLPPFLRDAMYYKEYWNSQIYSENNTFSRFIDNYAELDFLPELTDFSSERDSFIMIDNEMTHEPILLQYPEYEPAEKVTDFSDSKYARSATYCTTVAAMKKFRDFVFYLKENDCYDNTRIIIVSDHGSGMRMEDVFKTGGIKHGKEPFVATLLVKDFGMHGRVQEDMTFMLNADTPYLATKDIIGDAKNPFYGTPLKIENKNDYAILADGRPEGTRSRFKKKFDIGDDDWFSVKANIFEDENWSRYEAPRGK